MNVIPTAKATIDTFFPRYDSADISTRFYPAIKCKSSPMVLFERLDEEGNGNEIDTLTSCNEVFLVFLRYKELRGILYVKYL